MQIVVWSAGIGIARRSDVRVLSVCVGDPVGSQRKSQSQQQQPQLGQCQQQGANFDGQPQANHSQPTNQPAKQFNQCDQLESRGPHC